MLNHVCTLDMVKGNLAVILRFHLFQINERYHFFSLFETLYIIYVAPYSRPVPYSRHPPYSRHFFNETHENDSVWALFPIAVSDDPFSTQVCIKGNTLDTIFFGEAPWQYHARFRLTFRSSTEHSSFWNPALTLASFAHFFGQSCLD